MNPDQINRCLEHMRAIALALAEQREQLELIAETLTRIYKYGLTTRHDAE